jgi:hypothetical protein
MYNAKGNIPTGNHGMINSIYVRFFTPMVSYFINIEQIFLQKCSFFFIA